MTTYSVQYLIGSSIVNPWIALGYLDYVIFAIATGSIIMMELFFAVSAFLFSYRIFLLARLKNNTVTLGDITKAYLRKVLRMVPTVWIIFLLSWGIYPRMNSGPIWSDSRQLFATCSETWWTKLLMIGNLVPFFKPATYGCFYWSWVIDVDLQLALIVPWLVVLYLKWPLVGNIFCIGVILAGIGANMWITHLYNLKAGWIAS